jgi:AraC-like DNA-binding protein
MKLIITICLFCLFASSEIAQQSLPPQADSIIARLPQLQGEEKLRALQNLTALIRRSSAELTKKYLRQLIAEARLQNDVATEGHARMELVTVYYPQFDNDSIFIVGDEAIRFARQHAMYDVVFSVKQEYIRRHTRAGQMLTAIRIAEEAYEEAKELQNNRYMARILAATGGIYNNLEQYDATMNAYVEALEIADRERDYFGAVTFFVQNNFNAAWAARYLNLPNEMLRHADSMYVELGRFQQIRPLHDVRLYYFFVYFHRAIAYAMANQPQQALQAIRSAEERYSPQWAQMNRYFGVMLDDMWGVYHTATGNYDEALEHLNRLLEHYTSVGAHAGIQLANELIAQAHLRSGNYRTAANLLLQIQHRKDSVNIQRFYAQINEFRTIYELDRAELEKQRHIIANQRLRFTNTVLIMSAAALMLIVALVVWNRNRLAEKNRALYRQITELDRLTVDESIDDEENQQYKAIVEKMHNCLTADRNFANPKTTANTLIEQLNVSRNMLYQATAAVKGVTPTEYINNMKLNEARVLLKESDQPMKSIAAACGYTMSAFYRQFQKKYGISPAEYRKIGKNPGSIV